MLKRIILELIKQYQLKISPVLGFRCRFIPTCSVYTQMAIERFGIRRGLWLGLKRISKCHPFFHGDWYDPLEKFDEEGKL